MFIDQPANFQGHMAVVIQAYTEALTAALSDQLESAQGKLDAIADNAAAARRMIDEARMKQIAAGGV